MVEKDSPTTSPIIVKEKDNNVEEEKVEKDIEVECKSNEPEKEETSKKRSGKELVEEDPPKCPFPAPYS